MKEQHFEFFRRIVRAFSTFQKINQKNGRAGKVRIQWFWSKLKGSTKHCLFLLQTDCFHERRTILNVSESNWKGIFNISKNLPKKSTKKMATPVMSRYSEFGENWKVPKNCFFLLHTLCFHERTTFWMFQNNWNGTFNISKNQPREWPRR